MKKHLVLLSALLLVTVIASSQNYKKYYKAGSEFMRMGKYQDAVYFYSSLELLSGNFNFTANSEYEGL